MITVEQAEFLIQENINLSDIEEINTSNAHNSILKENIKADRNNPPFNRVTMDGIAINFKSWLEGNRVFKIQAIQKAGEPQKKLIDNRNCLEVMTGAVLPENCDCVIKVEDINILDGYAKLDDIEIFKMQNIHLEASDYKKDEILIRENTRLNSTHIGTIASVGKERVKVAKKISFAIVSTGDELVRPGKSIENHQIYMSNSYALENVIKTLGNHKTKIFHLKDNKDTLINKLKEIIDKFDIIILSGGISMGKFDYLPEILTSLEVKNIFHKITQKPGKPMWFGVYNDKPVFALPGNPVSTLVCFYKYIKPYLDNSKNEQEEYVILDEEFIFNSELTCFQPVKVRNDKGILRADIIKINTSGDYSSLNKSDGFIELPKTENVFKKGYIAKFFRW